MNKLLKVMYVSLLLTLIAAPAFSLSYELDFNGDGVWDTNVSLSAGESVPVAIWLDGYSCPPDDLLFGAQLYFSFDVDKLQVVDAFANDTTHGGPFDPSLSGFRERESGIYFLIASNFNYVTVTGNSILLGTIILEGTSPGDTTIKAANELGLDGFNDGFVSDCDLKQLYPDDAIAVIAVNSTTTTIPTTTITSTTTTSIAGECDVDSDCPDDGLYCNGDEFCDEASATCISTGNPCPSETPVCIEATDECESGVIPVTIQLTPEAWYQSRWVSLIKFLKIEGSNSHFDRSVTEVRFSPDNAVIMLPWVIDETTINCFGLLMPRWWANVDAIEVTVTTGSEEATTTMEINLLPFLLEQKRNSLRDE